MPIVIEPREPSQFRKDIEARRQYAQSRIADKRNRPEAYGLDRRGYNRDIVNRQYFGDRANRNTRQAIDQLMDLEDRFTNRPDDNKFSTGELRDFRNAFNYLTGLQNNKDNINPMYLPNDEDSLDSDYPNFAYGIEDTPMYTGIGEGTSVRPSEIYADPNYEIGIMGGTRPDADMSRSNPYLKDLSYMTAGPQYTDEDFFMTIPGTDGAGQRYIGPRLDELDETVRFEDMGYELQNPNPTRITNFDEYITDITGKTPMETAPLGYYNGEVIDREFAPNAYERRQMQDQMLGLGSLGQNLNDLPFNSPRQKEPVYPNFGAQGLDQMAGTFGLPFELFQDPGADGGFYDYLGRKIQGDEIDEENYEPYQEPTLEEKRRRFMETYG
tara:strand:- start:1770 stop:2918 length:1149 start_codon:yes stop_codon:yes gene_type:complete